MFAQASTTLPYPSDVVSATLAEGAHPWSIALDGGGRDLLARVGVTIGRVPVYKRVQLKIDVLHGALRKDRVMLPVSWEAVGGPAIFPKMEGTVHVEPDGTAATRLTLNASYDPPLGKLGQLVDRALMYRVAQMTMTDFVERLARALSAELEGAGTG